MIKRLFSIILCGALFISNTAFTKAFSDTQDDAVNFLRTQNVFEKALNFYPDQLANRGEFVMWTMRNRDIFFEENDKILEPFLDIGYPQEFAPYVAKAWQIGAVETNKRFYPFKKITKLDALKIVLASEGVATPIAGFDVPKYKDIPKDSKSRGVISKAIEMRIVTSKNDDEFGTNDFLTRLDVAHLLYKIRLSAHADEMLFQSIKVGVSEKEKEDIFNNIWQIIHKRYLYADEINDTKLMEAAITGMVDSLGDNYTVYFPKSDTSNFLQPLQGDLQGIGAQVAKEETTGYVLIVAPLRDSPAERAGLKSGDLVKKVNNIEIKDMSLDDAISLIKGPSGSQVDLLILRDGKEFNVTIVRAKVNIKSVYSEVKDNYLIIDIDLFGNKTTREFQEILDRDYNKNIKGIIIDLRGNPGGYLNTSIELLEFFLEAGQIGVVTEDAISITPKKLNGTGELKEVPLAVLVDEFSASASEIFAGAIQDYERGVIIGNKSFGKGTVQELSQFYDGSSFKITIAEWKTPNRRSINGIGITPDVKYDTVGDKIIDKAISELKKGRGNPKK